MKNARGMTVAELVIVIVLIGLLTGLMAPRVGQFMTKQSVVSARSGVVAMYAKAKASAVQRGRRTVLLMSGGTFTIRAQHPVTGALVTIGRPESMLQRYGVSVTATRDSLVFDPRGLGTESSSTTIVVSKGAFADTIQISPAGRVLR